MPDKHILIVGGGVIGLSIAYYALQKGCRVTLLERGEPAHDSCSLGNAGMITPSHFIPLAAPGMVGLGLRMLFNPEGPFAIRPRLDPELIAWAWKFTRAATPAHVSRSAPLLLQLNLLSRRLYAEFAAQTGAGFGLAQRGLLMLCKTEKALHEESKAARMAEELGLPVEVLDSAQTAKRDPGIQMDIAGAVYFPQDCHLAPQQFVAALTSLLEAGGADIRYRAEVSGFQAGAGEIQAARTAQGEITADEYVLAGGAWSPQIARDLPGIRLPLQAGKGYSLTLPAPKRLPELCSILLEARVAVTPMGGTLRFAGTMEIGGLDTAVNPRRVEGIRKSVPRYLPEFQYNDFRDAPVWSGLRPCSPDGLPYIGRFGNYRNLSVATGHAMMGLSLGPVTGLLLREILTGEPPSLAIAALSPDRYL